MCFNEEIFDYDNIEFQYGMYSGQIYKDGHEPVGIHRISYKDNSIFEGQLLNGMRSGYCRQINEDGSCYVGGFYKNKKEGFGTLYDADFKILM